MQSFRVFGFFAVDLSVWRLSCSELKNLGYVESFLMGDMLNQHGEHPEFAHEICFLMQCCIDLALVKGDFDFLYFLC